MPQTSTYEQRAVDDLAQKREEEERLEANVVGDGTDEQGVGDGFKQAKFRSKVFDNYFIQHIELIYISPGPWASH